VVSGAAVDGYDDRRVAGARRSGLGSDEHHRVGGAVEHRDRGRTEHRRAAITSVGGETRRGRLAPGGRDDRVTDIVARATSQLDTAWRRVSPSR
jgi:hypothetical protein